MPRKTTHNAQGGGSIRKRKDGAWEARFTIGRDPGTGKQIQKSVYGKTQAEVRKKLQQATTALDEGPYMEPSKMSVGQWLDIWIAEYTSGLKPGTLSLYKRHIKNYVKPFLGCVKLCALVPHQIQELYNRFLKGEDNAPKLTPKTIKNLHGLIHKMLQQAVELGYLRINPSDACKPPRVEKSEIRPLDALQIKAFLAAIRGHRFENVYIVDLFTGMRQSELMGLTWDCVDFTKGTLRIYRQLQLIDGEYQFGFLKNDKPRTITPAPFVMGVLHEQERMQAKWRLLAGSAWMQGDFIFTDELGAHLARQSIYKQFKQIVKKMGLPEARFHDLRHSYAVAAIQSGDDIKTIQENLGHPYSGFHSRSIRPRYGSNAAGQRSTHGGLYNGSTKPVKGKPKGIVRSRISKAQKP